MNPTQDIPARRAARLGQWVALLMAVTAALALLIALRMAPARSGPNCPPLVRLGVIDGCVTYPFTDVAAYVPTEYIWMYPAILLPLLLLTLVVVVRQRNGHGYGIIGQLALAMATIAATIHSVNYYIQLSVVQPSLGKGELDSLVLWSQYNPHGIFIALENLGYFFMGLVLLLLALMLTERNRYERFARYVFFIAAVVVIGAMAIMSLAMRDNLEYQYEVLALTLDWMAMIIGGVLLFFAFRRTQAASVNTATEC